MGSCWQNRGRNTLCGGGSWGVILGGLKRTRGYDGDVDRLTQASMSRYIRPTCYGHDAQVMCQ